MRYSSADFCEVARKQAASEAEEYFGSRSNTLVRFAGTKGSTIELTCP